MIGEGCTLCETGYYPTMSVSCAPCTGLSNCAECNPSDPTGVCTICLMNFYLVSEGTCAALPDE